MPESLMIAADTLTLREDPATGHKSIFAAVPWDTGDILCSFSSSAVLPAPTRYTLQLDSHRHILLHPEYLWYINHSCAPNIFFDTDAMQAICLRPIRAGEEIRFFYPSTEWLMAEPFDCLCGSPQCLGKIQGASVLPDEVLKGYRLTSYIRGKWQPQNK
jgi:hypothetical protein